jgi:hypothetical protein
MRANPNWLPPRKTAKIEMGDNWAAKITANPAWGVPETVPGNLTGKTNALRTLLLTPPEDRTPTINARIKAAEKELVDVLRDVKKRHFFVPPLTDADLVSLGLKPRDTNPTPIAPPTVRPNADVKLKGAGAFDIAISPERDISNEEKSYYGCKIVYELFEQGATPPTSEKQLTEMRFVRRKKESFVFQPQDSGKKAYFALRYENSKGEAGPWCPIFSVLIP